MADKKEREKRRVMVDFDGVLYDDKSGTDRNSLPNAPVLGALEFLVSLLDTYDVCIWSARFTYNFDEQTKLVTQWLRDRGLGDEHLEKITLTCVKLPAQMYIDDRAWRFNGKNFPTLKQIADFRPWNRT